MHPDGRYDIRYVDGDEEHRVVKELIRALDGGAGGGSDSSQFHKCRHQDPRCVQISNSKSEMQLGVHQSSNQQLKNNHLAL